MLREASLITSSVFRSLSFFLSTQPKASKWSLVSMMVQKGVLGYNTQQKSINEIESVDIAFGELLLQCSGEGVEDVKIQSAQT